MIMQFSMLPYGQTRSGGYRLKDLQALCAKLGYTLRRPSHIAYVDVPLDAGKIKEFEQELRNLFARMEFYKRLAEPNQS